MTVAGAVPTELAIGVLALIALIGLYLVVGLVNDVIRHRRRLRYRSMQRDLGILLFRPLSDAAAAADRLARSPRRILFDLIQRSATDLEGEADRRLRRLVTAAGLGPTIRRRIRSRSWRVRAQGAALASLLPRGDPGRLALLADRHALVRARAVEAMEAESIADQALLMVALLNDESRAVRLAAQSALLRGGAPVVPALERHLAHADGVGTPYAIEVAANLPDPRLTEVAIHHARSDRSPCRALAAQALGRLAPDSDVLVELLDDPSAEVRAAAALAIGHGRAEHRAAEIGRLLRDPAWSVRRASGEALAAIGPTGTATLRVYAEDGDAYARDLARQMLATLEAGTGPVPVGR